MRFASRLSALLALASSISALDEQIVLSNSVERPLPSLDTVLTLERDVSAFSNYLREFKSLYARILDPTGLTGNTSIFAPCDQAILSLHRKPHQGPVGDGEIPADLSSTSEEKRNAQYLETWTASHLIADSVNFNEVPFEADTMADGRKISFGAANEGIEHVILQPGGAQILSVSEAKDGTLYVIDRVLTF